jgi:pseudomonalisin
MAANGTRHGLSARGSHPRGILLAAALLTLGAAAISDTGHARAASTGLLPLTGNVQIASDMLSGLGAVTPTGVISPTQNLEIGVGLSRPDPVGENAYLADVYNPQSPNFHQFLDVSGFQARFGVPQARYAALVSWLQGGSLTVTPVAGSAEYVLADGPAAAVETLFQAPIDTYSVNGINFYANTSAPTVPADLGVLGVAGLQNFAHMRTLQQIHVAALAAGKEPLKVQSPGPGTNVGLTTPQDLWSIYDLPADSPTANEGQGESMAIFGWGCAEPSDNTAACSSTDLVKTLRTDETTYNLPQTPIQIDHFGTSSETVTDNSGTGEWTLDMPASTGMAPKADLEHLYFGKNGQDPDILAAYNGWDSDTNGPRQGSSSFAGCEATPLTGSQPGGPGNPAQGPGGEIIGNPNQDLYEAALKEAVGLGRTMFNSAGDLGANGCASNANTALNGVTPSGSQINNYPSSSTYVTTVGGTVLYWNGSGDTGATPATRAFEYAWPYSGGGTSLQIAAPSWQTGAFETQSTSSPGVTYPCTTNWEAPTSPNFTTYPQGTFCRGLPDVSAQSGDIISNGYFAGAGTSLSSPLWLGMWTRIQAASSNPGRVGFATPAIYKNNADCTRYENDFFDIGGVTNPSGCLPSALNPNPNTSTVASCDSNPGPFLAYSCSKPGWDYASGWGTPDITNLMKDLDGGNTAAVAFVPANVPESPASLLLPLAGVAAAFAALRVGRRRRRTRKPANSAS